MDDREKLIELIQEAYCPVLSGFADEEKVKWLIELDIVYNWEDIAEHLLANNVIVLPCPIGTMVYRIRKVGDPEIGYDQLGVASDIFDLDLYYQFGKTVFLTEKEARDKLKKMEVAKSER